MEKLEALFARREEELWDLDMKLSLVDAYYDLLSKVNSQVKPEPEIEIVKQSTAFRFNEKPVALVRISPFLGKLLDITQGIAEFDILIQKDFLLTIDLRVEAGRRESGVLEVVDYNPARHKFYRSYKEVCNEFGMHMPSFLLKGMWIDADQLGAQLCSNLLEVEERHIGVMEPLADFYVKRDFTLTTLENKEIPAGLGSLLKLEKQQVKHLTEHLQGTSKDHENPFLESDMFHWILDFDRFVGTFPSKGSVGWLHDGWPRLGFLDKYVILSKVRRGRDQQKVWHVLRALVVSTLGPVD
jgi:hypothetical protein